MPITVAIADDQELVRAGLRMIVEGEHDLVVVGEASNGDEAIALARRTKPDVVLMDVRMPGMDGIEATEELVAEASSQLKILMLTTFDLDEYVYDAMRVGASGFLLKDMPGEDIVMAIRQAARGTGSLLAPALTRRLIERFATTLPATAMPPLDGG